jgi:hypothetical protein
MGVTSGIGSMCRGRLSCPLALLARFAAFPFDVLLPVAALVDGFLTSDGFRAICGVLRY